MSSPDESLLRSKAAMRSVALARRKAQSNPDAVSRQVLAKILALPEYEAAQTVLFYADCGSEVRTRAEFETALSSSKRIVVPYCVDKELKLFHLEHIEELQGGMHRILEPRVDLQSLPHKRVNVDELDFVLVPGVAFDRHGGRVGRGKGYYDKLLQGVRRDTLLVAPAFQCQIFDEVPTEAHDISMDRVITETRHYIGRGR